MPKSQDEKLNAIYEMFAETAQDKKDREMKRSIEIDYKIKELDTKIESVEEKHDTHIKWHKEKKEDKKDNRGFKWVIIIFVVGTAISTALGILSLLKG
jgi:hypothetical protein